MVTLTLAPSPVAPENGLWRMGSLARTRLSFPVNSNMPPLLGFRPSAALKARYLQRKDLSVAGDMAMAAFVRWSKGAAGALSILSEIALDR